SNERQKNQTQKSYVQSILELRKQNDKETIKKILDEHWINVSIENEKNDWKTKELFSITITSLTLRKYSDETKKLYEYFEKFIFHPHFFDYGKEVILGETTVCGIFENDPEYVASLIIRILENESLSDYIRYEALRRRTRVRIDNKWLTRVQDITSESSRFKQLLYSVIKDKSKEYMFRSSALHSLAAADYQKCEYKSELIQIIDDPNYSDISKQALMAVQKYNDPVLSQRAIDYIYGLIEEETGKDPRLDYSLFYTCRSVRSSYDGVSIEFYQIRRAGTDNIVNFFQKIIYAGLNLELKESYENRKYLLKCIEFLGETENPKAIPILIDLYDNYSLVIKNGNSDRIKRSALIGMSNFQSEDIRKALVPRYLEYTNKYSHLGNRSAMLRVESILRGE
ncbi:MAG: hypothetical protein KAS49_05085, partial [Candidatus Cloacimonetes bacterium]|nr:hypothetical protein [Candidatus Cloacimonadota bacterium]